MFLHSPALKVCIDPKLRRDSLAPISSTNFSTSRQFSPPRVPRPVCSSVPLCSDSTSLVTSVSHCHDTLWDGSAQTAQKYVHEQPSKRIWGPIGSRGASGGGPGEIMISKKSSFVRLSVQFDHSISSNYSPSHHPIATQSASSLTAILPPPSILI